MFLSAFFSLTRSPKIVCVCVDCESMSGGARARARLSLRECVLFVAAVVAYLVNRLFASSFFMACNTRTMPFISVHPAPSRK